MSLPVCTQDGYGSAYGDDYGDPPQFGGYGDGPYGAITYDDQTRGVVDLLNNWPFETVRPDCFTPVMDILTVLSYYHDDTERTIDELRQQRFIDTATNDHLRKLATEVGIRREQGESTAHFRFRAQYAKIVARSDGTLPDVATVLRCIFGDDATEITLEPVDSEPVTRVRIPTTLIEDVPVSDTELADILRDAIPASDNIRFVTGNTFVFGESGTQGLGNGELR